MSEKVNQLEVVSKEKIEKGNIFLKRVRGIGRVVFTVCYNVLHEGNEIRYPGQVSVEEWKDQYFRAWHPSFQKQEDRQKKALDLAHDDAHSSMSRLKNVSVGDNRGAGMNVVRKEVESAFEEAIISKQDFFVQKVLFRMISKMAAGDLVGEKIREKIDSGVYEKELRNRLFTKDSVRRSFLKKSVDVYQKEVIQKRGKELVFFEKLQDLMNFIKEQKEDI